MKKAVIIVGICLTLVISVLSPALPLGEIWTAIDQYWKVWEKDRDLSRARAILPILEQACQDHPDKADLFSTRIFVLTQLKRDGDAIRLGGESFARFPQHRWVAAHYKNALINAGWREVERTNKAAAAQHFALAWRHWPDDPDVVNAWGYALYDHHGRPADAIAILEPALRRHQQHRWLPQTLAWSWYKHGDQLLAAGQTNSASAAWDLFWKTIGPDNPHAHMSYLWKLYALGRYQDAQPVIAASMRTTVPGYDTYFEIVPKMGDEMRRQGAVCREPAYCFTIYHDGEYREHDIDVEICEAVTQACPDSDMVRYKTIEGYPRAACVLHKGPYSTLGQAYASVFKWIEDNGYRLAGLPRESYIDGIWNRESEDEWLTEVQVPLEGGDR